MLQKSSQIQPIIVGKANFKSNVSIKKLLQAQQVNKELQNKKWWIRYKTYQFYHWQQIFQNMIQSKAQKIQLCGNENSTIIKEISKINFVELKILWLGNNNIDNVQALCFLKCQNLQVLSLYFNRINRIKSMGKLKFNKIKTLDFHENNIIEVKVLERMNLIQAQTNYLVSLFKKKFNNSTPIYQDLSTIFKLRCIQLRDIDIKAQNRIYQIKLVKMIKKRFRSLCLQSFYIQQPLEHFEEREDEFGYKYLRKL